MLSALNNVTRISMRSARTSLKVFYTFWSPSKKALSICISVFDYFVYFRAPRLPQCLLDHTLFVPPSKKGLVIFLKQKKKYYANN